MTSSSLKASVYHDCVPKDDSKLADDEQHDDELINDPLHCRATEVSLAMADDHANAEKDLDEGWAWIVLGSTFFISSMIWGQVISFNVYFLTLRQEFGESRSRTAWVGSVNQATVNLVSIIAGFSLMKLGPRGSTMLGGTVATLGYVASFFTTSLNQLLITYGLIVGCGLSLCFTANMGAISKYFRRHLTLATSLSVTGGGLGIMFFSHLLEYFSDTYGWRGSLLLQGGITLNTCLFGATFFPRDQARSRKSVATLLEEKIPSMTVRQRLTDIRVLLLMAISFLGSIGMMAILIVYRDLTKSRRGLTHVFENTMMAIGAGNIIGRFVPGFILRRKLINPLVYFILIFVVCNLVLFAIAFVYDPIWFICLNCIIGFGQGNFASVPPIIVAHIFGRREMAVTYGYLLFSIGIGLLTGGPFAGFVADYTGSYTNYLICCGSFLSLAVLLIFALYVIQERLSLKK